MKRLTYLGQPLEFGGTSIASKKPVPALVWLVNQGMFKTDMRILDYGAGKYGRNAEYLRQLGFSVVAVDKFNYNQAANVLPESAIKGRLFDVALTSYVLNVVPEHIENDILRKLSQITKSQIHITRGSDLISILRRVKQNGYTYKWLLQQSDLATYLKAKPTKADLEALAYFGFATTKGFQRLVALEDKGYNLTLHGSNRIYTK
jgi:hypothetical protein